ncbi:hypothetical protein F5141DRAFT_1150903 [Pisolithus sp. B1]|nr:hypothetical protein F5141DRAFT_1150903 [Pisolithus sp. B1]
MYGQRRSSLYTLPLNHDSVGIDPDCGLQFFKLAPAGYSVRFRATSAGQKREVGNHLEKTWKKSDNAKGANNAQELARCFVRR